MTLKPTKEEREARERIAKAFGRPLANEPPTPNLVTQPIEELHEPRNQRMSAEAQWIADNGWSGKQ